MDYTSTFMGQMKGNVHMAVYNISLAYCSQSSPTVRYRSIAALGHDSTPSSFATVILTLGKKYLGPCIRRHASKHGISGDAVNMATVYVGSVKPGVLVLPQFHDNT